MINKIACNAFQQVMPAITAAIQVVVSDILTCHLNANGALTHQPWLIVYRNESHYVINHSPTEIFEPNDFCKGPMEDQVIIDPETPVTFYCKFEVDILPYHLS